jgi:NAD(P)-dependent dehydrogenase (short-subunit alcohol dehydrogenase family)
MAWTPEDIPDLAGARAVVTGANSGIGFHTARELTAHGAHVVLAVRDEAKGREAAGRMGGRGRAVEVRPLDLADQASIRAFAEGQDEPLDLLVNNAGVMATPYRRTVDGFELQFGTNHLGHFALTGLLLDRLRAARAPRVVTVSSGAHRIGSIALDDLQSERGYRRWRAYGQSKLANLLFAFELQRRATAAGWDLESLAAHPGYAATNLQVRGPQMSGSAMGERLMRLGNVLFAQSDAMGARPTLRAAVDTTLPGGTYLGPSGGAEQRGDPVVVGSSQAARDAEMARRLWELSEDLTGVTYGWAPAPAV